MAGAGYERRFVRMFVETDQWWAQRAAASGSATEADLPDVTFASTGIGFAGEMKTTSEPYVYVDEGERDGLEAYADAYGMLPVVIGRFKQERAFYLWRPADMATTDAGTLRGGPDDGQWAAKVAEPGGTADGIHPDDLGAFHLRHALAGELGSGITEPPANPDPATWEGDA